MSFLNNVDKTIDGENIFQGDIFNCNQDFEVEGNAGASNQFLHKNVTTNALEWYNFQVSDNLTEGYCIDLSGNSIALDLHELTFSSSTISTNDFIPIIKIDGTTHTETRHHISDITNLVTLVGSSPIVVLGHTIAFNIQLLSELVASTNTDMFYVISNNLAYKVSLATIANKILSNLTSTSPISLSNNNFTFDITSLSELAISTNTDIFYTISNSIPYKVSISTIANKILSSLQSTAPINNVSGNFTFSINNLNTHSISNNDYELIIQANTPPHHNFYKISIGNLFQYGIGNITTSNDILLVDEIIFKSSLDNSIHKTTYDNYFKNYVSKLTLRDFNSITLNDKLLIYNSTQTIAQYTNLNNLFNWFELQPANFRGSQFVISPNNSTTMFHVDGNQVTIYNTLKVVVSGNNPTFEVGSRYTKLQLTTHTDRPLFRFDNQDNIIDGFNSGGLNLYALNGATNKLNFYDTYSGSGNMLEIFGGSAGSTKGHIKLYTPTIANSMVEVSIVGTKPFFKIKNPNIVDGASHRDILSINGTNHTLQFHGKNDTSSHNQIYISGGDGTSGGYTEFCNHAHGSSILKIDESGLLTIKENSANNPTLYSINTLTTNSCFNALNNSNSRSMFKIENNTNKINIRETNTANNRLMVETDCDTKTTSFKRTSVGNEDLMKIDHENGTFTLYHPTLYNQSYKAFEYNATTKYLSIFDGVGTTILRIDQTKGVGDIGLLNIPNGTLPLTSASASSGDMFLQRDGTTSTYRLCVHY